MPLIWGSGILRKLRTGRGEIIQSIYLVARRWQEGVSWVYKRLVLLSLKVTTKGWASQGIRDADLQQCGFKQVGYFSYNTYTSKVQFRSIGVQEDCIFSTLTRKKWWPGGKERSMWFQGNYSSRFLSFLFFQRWQLYKF